MRTIVWFRGNDLRLRDQAPLTVALSESQAILVYVVDPGMLIAEDRVGAHPIDADGVAAWGTLAASRVATVKSRFESVASLPYRLRYLRQAVESLRVQVAARGATLLLPIGSTLEVILHLVVSFRADQVFAQRQTDPAGRALASKLTAKLPVPLRLFEGETLVAPGRLRTSSGDPYSVFTPFSKAWIKQVELGRPHPLPSQLPALPTDSVAWAAPAEPSGPVLGWVATLFDDVAAAPLVSRSSVHQRNAATSRLTDPTASTDGVSDPPILGGEVEALRRLKRFVTLRAADYAEQRDRLDRAGTSRLSADLRFGCVSPRQIWLASQRTAWVDRQARQLNQGQAERGENSVPADQGIARFQTQLIWREFAYSTLWDRPELLTEPFQARFRGFPWRDDPAALAQWKSGHTGYPVVDAAARQLLTEGFVHNRARMIAASFLTKDLLIDFRRGEGHYLEWLIDGDRAQNDLGWQWSSGCGCDAQPYFRVFNPVIQAERFDPEGRYVQRYVPELAGVPLRYIHKPWAMPGQEQQALGIIIGKHYPAPIIDHDAARKRFLSIATEFLGASR